MKLVFGECQITSLMISKHWFRCRQETYHYLLKWCLRSMSPFGMTRPQRVNVIQFIHCCSWKWRYFVSCVYSLYQNYCSLTVQRASKTHTEMGLAGTMIEFRGARRSLLLRVSKQWKTGNFDGILPKGPYRPCVSMAGRALLAGYHRFVEYRDTITGDKAFQVK